MKVSQTGACWVGLSLAIALAAPGAAQQTTIDDLKKELDSLRAMVEGIQKDIRDMKGMLARQAPPGGSASTGRERDRAACRPSKRAPDPIDDATCPSM